jgi:hypothetical protein
LLRRYIWDNVWTPWCHGVTVVMILKSSVKVTCISQPYLVIMRNDVWSLRSSAYTCV